MVSRAHVQDIVAAHYYSANLAFHDVILELVSVFQHYVHVLVESLELSTQVMFALQANQDRLVHAIVQQVKRST